MLIAATVLFVRLAILPPAIAVGAPGAGPAQVLVDTKGRGLRIFAIFALALIPVVAVGGAVGYLIGQYIEDAGSVPAMLGLLLAGAVTQTIALTLMAVIASLLFIALAREVRRPPAAA
jgi:hypothetical protein